MQEEREKFEKFLVRMENDKRMKQTFKNCVSGQSFFIHKALLYVPGWVSQYNKEEFCCVIGMFALHPIHSKKYVNFGHSSQYLRLRGESIDKRFEKILTAKDSEKTFVVKNFLSLLKKDRTGIDYYQLFKDFCHWDHPDHFVQDKWAEKFWKLDTEKLLKESVDEN